MFQRLCRQGEGFELATHRVRRIILDELEGRLHNDPSVPRPDPSRGA